MVLLSLVFTVVFSYLLGSVNSAITVCRILKKADIRDYGSKNAGLTNVLRVFGKGPALATLLFDLAKGIIAVVVCRLVVTYGFDVMFFNNDRFIGYIAGLSVMIGHIFPVFYGFHGGKGVLVAATTLIAIDPLTCFFAVLTFAIIVAITRYVSVGSIIAAFSYPLFTILTQSLRQIDGAWQNMLVGLVIAFLITYMHKPNIERLKAGTENKFSFKSSKSNDSDDKKTD
ncbi:MAG: glycerol-3-phosphate 1-O-acyltransferase PlsY [Ruminococcus sp.]|nr:glycerol-3-phosphate 1-O-acyltransferase PlsY [Ruminococcus sp.]